MGEGALVHRAKDVTDRVRKRLSLGMGEREASLGLARGARRVPRDQDSSSDSEDSTRFAQSRFEVRPEGNVVHRDDEVEVRVGERQSFGGAVVDADLPHPHRHPAAPGGLTTHDG